MNNTPNYQKWFNGSSAVPAAEIETTTVVPGQVLAGNSGNRNQAYKPIFTSTNKY